MVVVDGGGVGIDSGWWLMVAVSVYIDSGWWL